MKFSYPRTVLWNRVYMKNTQKPRLRKRAVTIMSMDDGLLSTNIQFQVAVLARNPLHRKDAETAEKIKKCRDEGTHRTQAEFAEASSSDEGPARKLKMQGCRGRQGTHGLQRENRNLKLSIAG
jgi:hypothetical protein